MIKLTKKIHTEGVGEISQTLFESFGRFTQLESSLIVKIWKQ